jgi:hypothetical protein
LKLHAFQDEFMNAMNSEMNADLERKLTRLYVALAMTRNIAQRAQTMCTPDESARSVVTLVDVASGILEEILDPPLLYHSQVTVDVQEMELLM